jgi:hypothetical protein
MRRKTISILAVAITTSACAVATEPNAPSTSSEVADERAALQAPTPSKEQPPSSAAPAPAPTPGPKPAPTCDRDALNSELSSMMLEPAIAKHTQFRCLCDDKGYPLVGNINSKGTTATAFCGAIRDKGLL